MKWLKRISAAIVILFAATAFSQQSVEFQQDGKSLGQQSRYVKVNCLSPGVKCTFSGGKFNIQAQIFADGEQIVLPPSTTFSANSVPLLAQDALNFVNGDNLSITNTDAGTLRFSVTGLSLTGKTGSYDDLVNEPVRIGSKVCDSTDKFNGFNHLTGQFTCSPDTGGVGGSAVWGGISGVLSSQPDLQSALDAKANTSSLATVATSGSYNDLTNKPSIPAAQVNSDWSAVSGVARILNKPTLGALAAKSSVDYSTLEVTNKPTLGTAAALDVPAAGNAAAGEVVRGSDTRLTDSRVPVAHVLNSASHTVSGLTTGHYLRANSATTFGFTAIVDADLPATIARDSELPVVPADLVCTGTQKFSGYLNGAFTCTADQEGSPGSGITSLGASAQAQTGSTQVLATANDENVTLSVASATNTHTFTAGWMGTLSKLRGGSGQDNSALIFPASGTIAITSQIPPAQVNSDWNAVSGIAQILNKPTLAQTKTAAAGQPLLSYDATTGLFTQGALTAAQVGALPSSTVLPANTAATANQFLTAYNNTTGAFSKAQPAFGDLSGSATDAQVPDTITLTNITQVTTRDYSSLQNIPTAFTPAAHALVGATHTASGLTIGHVLRASSATTFGFAAIQDSDLPSTIARDSELPSVPITAIQNGGVGVAPSAGAVNFAAGSNVTLTTSGNTITIAASGTGGGYPSMTENAGDITSTKKIIAPAFESSSVGPAALVGSNIQTCGLSATGKVQFCLDQTSGPVYSVNGGANVELALITDNVASATTLSAGADRTKLDGIAAGAEVNVNADWTAVSGDAQILNKPTLATVATSGSYNDLANKPTLAATKTSVVSQWLKSFDAATGAFTSTQPAYSELSGLPTLGTAAAKNIPASGDASATEVVYGTDTRLTNARTPSAHSQAETTITFTDVTTGNASLSAHGFLPKLGGGTANFLRADGAWATPASGATPGGTNTQVQFNDGGSALGGDSGLTYNKTTDTLIAGTGSARGFIDILGGAGAAANPAANYCRQFFNTTTGKVEYLNSSGASCAPVPTLGGLTVGYLGIPTTNTTIAYQPAPYALSIATNCTGSYLKAKASATSEATINFYKNGVQFGSATFAAAGTVATFTCSATSFVAGDVLEIVGGGDPTLANIGGVIAGTR
jgi:hypothetical protein